MELSTNSSAGENITFTPGEWKHFLNEIEMRGVKKVDQCINNARYLAKLDRSDEQIRNGYVIAKTWDELEAMAR